MNPFLKKAGILTGTVWLIIISFTFQVKAQSEASGSDTPQITLIQAIDMALANNTQMKRALLSVKDADQQIRTAWSNVMPSIAASATYTRNLEIPVNFIPAILFDPNAAEGDLVPVAFGTDNSWNGGFSASQIIFNGQAFVGISSAELYKSAQNEALRATSQGIVTQTRITYYQVLIAQEQVRLIKAQYDRIKENLDDTKKLLEQGFTDDYTVLQLEVQLSNVKPQLTNAEFAVENAKRELLDVMGLPLDLTFIVAGNLSSYDIYSNSYADEVNKDLKKVDKKNPYLSNNDSLMFNQAFENRGDLRILDVQNELQNQQLKAQWSQYLPTVAAQYNLMWTAAQPGTPIFFGTEDRRARSQVLGLNVQMPLFQGFKRDAAIQQTRIRIKDIELQQHQSERDAVKELLNAQQTIEEAYLTVEARQKAIQQAKTGYERAIARQKAGVGSQQEVTDANLQLQQAEIGYAQTVFTYLMAKAQYDQAMGKVPFVDDIKYLKKNIELNK
ncbi:MAG TPA: hypothetical protein DEQ34_00810 [Balneolaceae bacterium]|nr:hypothetical protein [Balneolaceae bacterium]|tara:strand:+ start:121166 stop:122668 length:1503 start_codon:yes stop_codon:yes gene_type:complete